jgi:competence protein ComEC
VFQEKEMKYHIRPSMVLYRITQPEYRLPVSGLVRFRDRLFLFPHSGYKFLPSKENIDYCIYSVNSLYSPEDLMKKLGVRFIVFDSSVPSWKKSVWKKQCDSLHIPYHDVQEKGAFVVML